MRRVPGRRYRISVSTSRPNGGSICVGCPRQFDGAAVMHVLRTHPRVYVNGILLGNPHYQAA